MENCVLQLG